MQLRVIKIGGNIVDDKAKLSSFLQAFAALDGFNILVHGGGKIATEIGKRSGIEPNYINGRRITDQQTIDLVTMVYGGLINKQIVAELLAYNCNAIGLTGADANLIPAVKRPVNDIDYGFVGDVISANINGDMLNKLLHLGLTPVFAPLTHDNKGQILNTNADTVAQKIAKAMAQFLPVQLIYCFEKKGVLINPADDNSVINSITKSDYSELKEKEIITGGMIPKLDNAFEAISQGVETVVIGHADDIKAILAGDAGTVVMR